MKNIFIMSLMGVFCILNADAAVKTKNHTAEKFAIEQGMEMDESDAIATLENDIAILDEEIAKCEKSKKGWIAATVIGSAGVVSTGIAAGVQGVKIKDQKDTISDNKKAISDWNTKIADKNTEIKSLNAETAKWTE